ncbi:MAG: hypothetical protein ABI841_05750 [Chloroflexota bacterium]
MPLSVSRMQEIVVDATLHSTSENYTEEELEFRAKIEVDVADAEKNGWIIDVPSDL